MKATIRYFALAAGTLLLLGTVLLPAQTRGAGKNMRMYDPATETSIKGTVENVTQVNRGRMTGTHLTVNAGGNTTEVVLGPAGFIADRGFTFQKGDAVDVVGSKVTMAGASYFIAREITTNGKTLTLRDKNGRAEWAGGPAGRRAPVK